MHVKSVYTSVDFAHATSVSCNRIARRAFTQCSRAVYNGTARRWFKRFEFGRVRVTVSVSHNWYTYDNISLNRGRGVMSQQCKTLPRRYTSSISFDVHINVMSSVCAPRSDDDDDDDVMVRVREFVDETFADWNIVVFAFFRKPRIECARDRRNARKKKKKRDNQCWEISR